VKSVCNIGEATANDPLVAHVRANLKGSMEDCVVALVNEKHSLLKRIEYLESVCPRKIKMPDGKFFIWQCPIDLIPETIAR